MPRLLGLPIGISGIDTERKLLGSVTVVSDFVHCLSKAKKLFLKSPVNADVLNTKKKILAGMSLEPNKIDDSNNVVFMGIERTEMQYRLYLNLAT